jgi:golgi phosphoprotein 3
MLSIAEELFLLALNDAKGDIPNSIAIPLQFALGGALLTELFLAGKIQQNEHKKVVLVDETPCTDPLLRETLEQIRLTEGHPHKIAYWIKELNPKPKKFLKRLGEGLVQKGILAQKEKRYLWVIPYVVYPQQDASAKYWVKQHLRGVVLAGEVADFHSVMVLSLVRVGGLLDFVFTRDELKAARKQVDRITKDALLGQAVTEAIQETEDAVAALVIAAMTP